MFRTSKKGQQENPNTQKKQSTAGILQVVDVIDGQLDSDFEQISPPESTSRSKKKNLDVSDEGIEEFQDLHPSATTKPKPAVTSPESSTPPFVVGKRLNKKPVYRVAIGMFKKAGFQLDEVCFADEEPYPGEDAELARIYSRGKETYILYYPGKDNELSLGAQCDDGTTPLKTIIESANKKIDPATLQSAKKIYLVAENNTYCGVSVAHWVKGRVDTKGALTIEDSMDRSLGSYDESAIQAMIPHQTVQPSIHRGWQNMIFDTWQCAHFALQAVDRELRGWIAPRRLDIDKDIVHEHVRLYRLGNESIRDELAKKEQQENNPNTVATKKATKSSSATSVDLVLKSIQAVNVYLKKRAITSPTNYLFFTAYRGKDYYDRRNSWQKILKEIETAFRVQRSSSHGVSGSLYGLIYLIEDEAKKYKPRYFYESGNYCMQLMNLKRTILANRDAFISKNCSEEKAEAFQTRIANYHSIYEKMNAYHLAANAYHDQGWKQDNRSIKDTDRDYSVLYNTLSKEDKRGFLTPEQEHRAEYEHTLNF